jgi:hypothetical protein
VNDPDNIGGWDYEIMRTPTQPDWKQIKLDLVTAMGRRHMLLGWKLPKERAKSCRAELPAIGWIKFAMVGGVYRWVTWCIGEGLRTYHRDEMAQALDDLLSNLTGIHARLSKGIGDFD